MKLMHPLLSRPLELGRNRVPVLAVESPQLFRQWVLDLSGQSQGEEGSWVLSCQDEVLDCGQHLLVVSDMDNTLLTAKEGVPACNRATIQLFRELGGRFTVATGRPPESIRAALGDTQLSCPAIAKTRTVSDRVSIAIDHPKPIALCCDSRAAAPGALFVCLPGLHADGHDFAGQAVAAGAAGVVCEHPLPELPADLAPVMAAHRAIYGPARTDVKVPLGPEESPPGPPGWMKEGASTT